MVDWLITGAHNYLFLTSLCAPANNDVWNVQVSPHMILRAVGMSKKWSKQDIEAVSHSEVRATEATRELVEKAIL